MNRRAQIAMTPEEQLAFLASATTLILSSIDPGKAEILENADLCTSVLANVRSRSFGSNDPSVREILRGQAAKHGAIRVRPQRIASWDHSKLGGVY